MAIEKKETKNEKGFRYDGKLLNKFADTIIEEYDNDFYKFCEDKKAMRDGAVIHYEYPSKYYEKFVENTEYAVDEDFYRPNTPFSFWSRIYDQAEKIMIAKVEEHYRDIQRAGGKDPRIEALHKVRQKLGLIGTVEN